MELTMEQERWLRRVFKMINHFMVLLWRLGLGSVGNGHRWFGAYMVIVHRGRRSGKIYRTPVNFAEIEGDFYCTAGFGRAADWYQNIMAEPKVELWLPGGRWIALAEDVTASVDRRQILRQVLIGSGFAGPLFGADPRQMTAKDYDRMLQSYRLVRLQRQHPVAGTPSPGDLVWLWPLALVILLLMRSSGRPSQRN